MVQEDVVQGDVFIREMWFREMWLVDCSGEPWGCPVTPAQLMWPDIG